MTAPQRPQRDEAGHVPYYAGEHVPDMDEGDPEMEAWMESLPPVDIDKLARDLKQVEADKGLSDSVDQVG
jgi:hypothetical protein